MDQVACVSEKKKFQVQDEFENEIKQFKPDIVLLIDYPGFNLKIAEFAKNEGLKVIYYITPKIWAWIVLMH